MGLIRAIAWTDGSRLSNPGIFLRMVTDSVCNFYDMLDKDGLSYTRKAMISCWMAFNINGRLKGMQLKPEMQNIIRRRRAVFGNTDNE